LLALWWLATSLAWVNPFILPAPQGVFNAIKELWSTGELIEGLGMSFLRVGAGFLISVVLGTSLGLLLGLNSCLRALFNPLLQFLRPIPPIAWIPLSILWFGLGEGPAYSLTTIASFFPIVLNTWAGVEGVSPRHLDVARSFGCSRWMILKDVIWPAALPSILTGYRVGFGIAWMAVMAAEMVATPSGIGYLIQVSQNLLRTDRVVAGMIIIGCVGLVFDLIFSLARQVFVPWSVGGQHE
jgi:ABC-type nitrate/sulfonate/bicarbonate transport system permease component